MPDRIVDTNILLAYVRGKELYNKIEAQFALRTSGAISLVSVVSEGELRALALQFVWGKARQQEMEHQLAYCTIVPLPFSDVVETYAEIDDYSRRRGVAMGKNDLWIAATASITGARLLTTDKDFDHLNGVYLTRDWVDPVQQPSFDMGREALSDGPRRTTCEMLLHYPKPHGVCHFGSADRQRLPMPLGAAASPAPPILSRPCSAHPAGAAAHDRLGDDGPAAFAGSGVRSDLRDGNPGCCR